MAVLRCYSISTPPSFFRPTSLVSRARFISPTATPFCSTSSLPKVSTPRVVSALISEESAIGSGVPGLDFFKLTYLEGNSWLWEVDECKILVDPVLVGNLDFGIPFLYDAAKKFLKNLELSDLPEIDCLLITQSLDDHCHLNTLKPLSQKSPNLPVVATPNAKPLLDPLFTSVTYLEPGQSSVIESGNGLKVRIKATAGPVLGPPWQRPENGYLVVSPQDKLTLYYEPHCVYDKKSLENERADIVITPVIKQLLPNFTLVSGQEDAVKLAKLLRARFVVAMKNGDLDSKGFLATIIQAEGTVESFKELMLKEAPEAMVIEPVPGLPLQLPLKNFAPSGMTPDQPQFRMDKKLIDQFIKQEALFEATRALRYEKSEIEFDSLPGIKKLVMVMKVVLQYSALNLLLLKSRILKGGRVVRSRDISHV